MSGKSACSRRQTEPIVWSRVACAVSVMRDRPSSREKDQAVLADLHLVPALERALFDARAVEKRSVQAAEILQDPAGIDLRDRRVPPRDRDVVQEDVAIGCPADRGLRLLER